MELDPVPEPKATKHRVHLDLHVATVEELTGLGATAILPAEQSGFHWTRAAGPGGRRALCVPPRRAAGPPPLRRDRRLRRPRGDRAAGGPSVFGVEADSDGDDWGVDQVPGMPFEHLVFEPVPEPKTVKNRIHWDVRGDVAELERAGATVLSEMPRWVVMADPEGNEFCVFPPD